MMKLENDVVTPKNPKFYKRFVDNSIRRREKGTVDELLHNMNNYPAKIKFTIEALIKFLDTESGYQEDGIKTSVYRSDKKTTRSPELMPSTPIYIERRLLQISMMSLIKSVKSSRKLTIEKGLPKNSTVC